MTNEPTHEEILAALSVLNRAGITTTSNSPQLTISELIDKLPRFKTPIVCYYDDKELGVNKVGSYRGYYDELAIRPCDCVGDTGFTSEELQDALKAAIGTSYYGYKGGEFIMNEDTPVWLDQYGRCSSLAIIDVLITNEKVVLITQQKD